MAEFVYALVDQSIGVDGVPYFVHQGEVWDASDPVVKVWMPQGLFGTVPPRVFNSQGKSREDYLNEEFSPEVRSRGGRRG